MNIINDVQQEVPENLCQLFRNNAVQYAHKPALSWRKDTKVKSLTWSQYYEQVQTIASAMLNTGLVKGQVIAIYASNRPEHMIADQAALLCGAIPVTLYATLSPSQLDYILSDCLPSLIVVEGFEAMDRINSLPWVKANQPKLIYIPKASEQELSHLDGYENWVDFFYRGQVHYSKAEPHIKSCLAKIKSDDPITIIYTSGTTGPSKGVVITHGGIMWQVEALTELANTDSAHRSICYLPLAHIAERVWSIYFPMKKAGDVMFCPEVDRFLDCMRIHQPTNFLAVPRIWEKLADGIKQQLAIEQNTINIEKIAKEQSILLNEWKILKSGQSITEALYKEAQLARQGLVSTLRRKVGLDQTDFAVTTSAPLSEDIRDFFASIGIQILSGYGMTETGGVAVFERKSLYRDKSVGIPISGAQLTIADDGEILVKSPGNTPAYFKLPEKTAELYDDNGWLRTGDLGFIDEEGVLRITSRKKELIINTAGKNISPNNIENLIIGQGVISQVLAVGDAKPYITALITPDSEKLKKFALHHKIDHLPVEELVLHPIVIEHIQTIVNSANKHLSRPEQVKKFKILTNEWTIEKGEITPTMKLRRSGIISLHQEMINEMYMHQI